MIQKNLLALIFIIKLVVYLVIGFVCPNSNYPSLATPGTTRNSSKHLPLTVTQYYYPEWPDKDTPSTDPMSILHLIRDVNAAHPAYRHPLVVHCSAGVGRTGTYITLDAMLEKVEAEGRVNVFGFVGAIRERRQYLVQTAKQYVFVHEALYEYCMYGFTDVEAAGLEAHCEWLREPAGAHKVRLCIYFIFFFFWRGGVSF